MLAVIGALVFQTPIKRAWHPTTVGLDNALLDDLAVEIVQPEDGTTISPGTVELVVEASGGTLGEGFVADAASAGDAPADPEEQVGLTITVVALDTGENTATVGVPIEDCAAGCERATYEVTLDQPGQWSVFIEAKTADTRAFTTTDGSSGTPTDSVTVTVE